MHRGYTEGSSFIGAYVEPQLKRLLVDRAVQGGHSLSAEIRSTLQRELLHDSQSYDSDENLAAA